VEQAEANVLNIKAQLAKTIIRAPINGIISTISPSVGEFVSSGQTIANVVNKKGLQVKAYINSADAKKIKVGNKVIVEGIINAVISRIAPAIDPKTQKVEVLIALVSSEDKDVVVGQYVNISILQENEITDGSYFLPLQSIKVTPIGAYVYTINDNKIEERIVTIGSVLGDRIEVSHGLAPDMEVLMSIRGLKTEQEVVIQ
jgi:membrane fusion protein (multidrug efflux system)